MTHHDKNPAEDKGIAGNQNPRDYSDVEQNRNFLPNVEELTVKAEDAKEVGSKGKNKKGSKKAAKEVTKDVKVSYDIDSDYVRNDGRCASCGNALAQYRNPETGKYLPVGRHILKDKKMKKAVGGKYLTKSPGAPEGQYMSPLCPDCQAAKDAGENIDFKTALVIGADGRVSNVPVSQL